MKILIVTTGYPRCEGDIFGNFVQDLANNLVHHELQISVLAPHEKGLPFFRKEYGVAVYRLPYFPCCASVAYGSGIPTNLKKISCKIQLPFFILGMMFWTCLLSFKHQLIHSQWSMGGFFALSTFWLHRKPVVTTYHGSDLNSSGVLKKLSSFVAKRSHQNICVSKAQQEVLQPLSSQVCPYTIDTDRFISVDSSEKKEIKKELGVHLEKKILLYVGSIIPVKQPKLLVEIILKIDEGIQLLWVGQGMLMETIQKMVIEMNLSDKIEIIGHVPYQNIHKYFQIADCHILTSKSEGRPNVIYQAMASSVPSVSTAVGGIPEMIDDNASGRLLEPVAETFAKAINELMHDPERLNRLGQHARLKLEKLNCDKKSVYQIHHKVYSDHIN